MNPPNPLLVLCRYRSKIIVASHTRLQAKGNAFDVFSANTIRDEGDAALCNTDLAVNRIIARRNELPYSLQSQIFRVIQIYSHNGMGVEIA